MTIDTSSTVRELAVGIPGATTIFERHHIDYCCGGAATLAAACAERGVAIAPVVDELEGAARRARPGEVGRWREEPLCRITEYIVTKHHAYTSDEIARLQPLLDKIVRVHGERHPEFAAIRATFVALADELGPHLMKEERVLFPFIEALELSKTGAGRAPMPPFGSVSNPVRMMTMEHDTAGNLLRSLRKLTHDYVAPADGCGSVHAVFAGLAAFERDLHEHIHLENNVLFPRAIELEGDQALED